MHKILTLLLALCLGTIHLSAQLTDVADIRETMWPANDPHSKVTETPSKWDDASAVIIFQSFHRYYSKKGLNIYNAAGFRKRIKIQDNSALEAFSEFGIGNINTDRTSYDKKADFLVGEIKVIKPNGSSFLINFDEAVDDGEGGKKVAIPNLEIGDIIDYYYYQNRSWKQINGYAFQPVITTLGEEYPIMNQDLGFTVNKRFYVSFNTYNGAPPVKTTEIKKDETITYFIEDSDRVAEDRELWFHPYRELPTIKFQVVQAQSEKYLAMNGAFLNYNNDRLKQTANWDDFSDLTGNIMTLIGQKGALPTKYLAQHCGNCNQHDRIQAVYNYWRFHRYTDTYEKYGYVNQGLTAPLYADLDALDSEHKFLVAMGHFLKKEGVDFEILATIPKKYGELEQMLLPAELLFVLKVNLPNETADRKTIYLSPFSAFTAFGEIPSVIKGQKAYVLSSASNFKQTTVIPSSDYSRNKTHGIMHVSWDADNIEKANIDRKLINEGHHKHFDRGDLLTVHDIIAEETRELGLSSARIRLAISKKGAKSFNDWYAQAKKDSKENQLKVFENVAAQEFEFEIEDYHNPIIINTGRWNGPFSYSDAFATTELVKKAGKNYIFEIGKLIGKQLSIDEDQVDREHDIYMAFARTFQEEIIVDIPEGYVVEGLDRLNVSVENKTGKFESVASIVDGKLHLNTIKSYSNSSEKVADWPLMLEFLEAAYELSQEKILFKKSTSSPVSGTR